MRVALEKEIDLRFEKLISEVPEQPSHYSRKLYGCAFIFLLFFHKTRMNNDKLLVFPMRI